MYISHSGEPGNKASFTSLPPFLATFPDSQGQWRSQDEQVTWAQHGHTQCVRINMHLLGDLGHTPAMKILHSEITSEAVFGHKYHSSDLPVNSLHVRMKLAITHAKLIFDRNFLHYFYTGTSELNVGTGPGMPGCSYATAQGANIETLVF